MAVVDSMKTVEVKYNERDSTFMEMHDVLDKNVSFQCVKTLDRIKRYQQFNKNEVMKFAFDTVFGDPSLPVILFQHMMSQIVKHSTFLNVIARRTPCIFIKCFENLLVTSDKLTRTIPILFEKLYDCDVLDQEHFYERDFQSTYRGKTAALGRVR